MKPTSPRPNPAEALEALEQDLGEKTLFRTTARFLAAQGLESVPLDTWGLVVLTPTRVVFRHFPQPHPLFGGKDAEVRWEVPRKVFTACTARRQTFWEKWFSGTPDHIALTGAGTLLAVEAADNLAAFPQAWLVPV